MCEIAILDPSLYGETELKSISLTLFESMGDGLGIVSVHDLGDHYEYAKYKSLTPQRHEVLGFIEDQQEAAERFFVHGRLATTGEVTQEHVHPLEVDCPKCDVDYLIHNGIVRDYHGGKHRQEVNGHEYNTEVDSEKIAHDYGEVPTYFPDGGIRQEHKHQAGWILMNSEAILIHGGRGYRLTKDARMAMQYRSFGPNKSEKSCTRILMEPWSDN